MKKRIFFTLSMLGCLCFTTCKKDKPSKNLPPITQEGKNTIGFKVNGEVWTPFYECRYFGNPCGEIDARYGPPNNEPNHISLGTTRRANGNHSSLSIVSMTPPIINIGNKYDSVYIEYTTGSENSLGKSYTRSPSNTMGIFEITKIDPIAQIISGVFSFKLYNSNGGVTDSIEITDGRFDFKMNACICR